MLHLRFAPRWVFVLAVITFSLGVSGWFASTSRAEASQDGLLLLHVASEPSGQTRTVEAKIVIDAPPAAVWSVLTNYPEMKNILPGYRKSSVLRSNATGKVLDIAMKVSPILPLYNYQVQVRENRAHYRISLQRLSGDFKDLEATYKLQPQRNGSQTLLSYQLSIDPGFNVPGMHGILKTNTEKSLKALEKRVEKDLQQGNGR